MKIVIDKKPGGDVAVNVIADPAHPASLSDIISLLANAIGIVCEQANKPRIEIAQPGHATAPRGV